ncbi:MAG: hypothetical protein RR280_07465 [Bacteroidaceae bacterium]
MKTYYSKNDLSFNLRLNKGSKHIVFNPLSTGGGIYSTSDEEEIEALENSSLFNQFYSLIEQGNDSTENELQKKVISKEMEKIEHITNAADAKIFLIERGYNGDKKSKEALKEGARNMGFEFPNLK